MRLTREKMRLKREKVLYAVCVNVSLPEDNVPRR